MDREIPKEQRRRESMKRRIKIGGMIAVPVLIIVIIAMMLGSSVKSNELIIKTAERASLESSVSASGKIVPLYELTIVSPVSTRILEVYCNAGDSVESGESILKLDLHSTEADYRRMADEVNMKRNELEQTSLNNDTYLTDLEMQIKVKEMSLSHLEAEVANERRLDSIGSGTGDRIRQAELAYAKARMEMEQLTLQLANERKTRAASYRSKELEGRIAERNLESMERTLDDARVKAPRRGTVTWLNSTLGASIGAGEKLAVVSDLHHFKIEGEIPEGSSGKLSVGSPVNIRINRSTVKGHISTISPQSVGGMVQFTVFLDDDSSNLLRSGLRADLNVVYDTRDDVVRIANGAYFQGPGVYYMFVKTAPNSLERRTVTLGDSNFDYVEVKSGIEPGEEVVVSDMKNYRNKEKLKIKD